MWEALLARYMPKYEQCHTEYHERAKYYKQPQIVLILSMLKTLSELLAWQPDDYLGRYFGQMRLDKHFHGQFSRRFMSASLWLPWLLVMACRKESLM